MSKWFSNLWLLGKADVAEIDALLWHEDLECNSIKFNKKELVLWSTRYSARSLQCNLIQINKTEWVCPLRLAPSHSHSVSHQRAYDFRTRTSTSTS